MILPFSLSKPQRISEILLKILFVVYLTWTSQNQKGLTWFTNRVYCDCRSCHRFPIFEPDEATVKHFD